MRQADWDARSLGFALILCLSLAAHAAETNREVVIRASVPVGSGKVYVAGNIPELGSWDAHKVLMSGTGKQRKATLNLAPGTELEFKFTEGSWESVETTASGGFVVNRHYTVPVTGEAVYAATVEAWRGGKPAGRKSTASASVSILSTNFAIPELGRERRVWIYLPPGYVDGAKTFPVLYMQDGQNVFDDATSFAGEWGVDETLDKLHTNGGPDCIVVAVDNGGMNRLREYRPPATEATNVEGDEYIQFIAHELKAYVDAHYRTQPERMETAIGGSSMGGLISLYAALKYPKVFGRALLFSTSFQMSPELFELAREVKSPEPPGRFYFCVGKRKCEIPISFPSRKPAWRQF